MYVYLPNILINIIFHFIMDLHGKIKYAILSFYKLNYIILIDLKLYKHQKLTAI